MAKPARSRATYEDLLRVPEPMVAELVGGELYASPRPSPIHAQAASAILANLWTAFHFGRGGPGGWWILTEPELHLGEDVLVPDVGGWRRERMPGLPETAAIELRPDWVCEVISPATGRLDRVRKMPVYAANGVPRLWLIDPGFRTLEVFRLHGPGWLLVTAHGGDAVVRAEPFDAIEMDLLALWGESRPAPAP